MNVKAVKLLLLGICLGACGAPIALLLPPLGIFLGFAGILIGLMGFFTEDKK